MRFFEEEKLMSKEIKIGLIGAGWMGKAHTTAFHNARMIFGDDMPVFELVHSHCQGQACQYRLYIAHNCYIYYQVNSIYNV